MVQGAYSIAEDSSLCRCIISAHGASAQPRVFLFGPLGVYQGANHEGHQGEANAVGINGHTLCSHRGGAHTIKFL